MDAPLATNRKPPTYWRRNPSPTAHFACERCGVSSSRSLGGSNVRKGYQNRWCSMACRVAANAEARKLKTVQKLAAQECWCRNCGVVFCALKFSERLRYCSVECLKEATDLMKPSTGPHGACWCRNCMVEYTWLGESRVGLKYCSAECKRETRRLLGRTSVERATRAREKAVRRSRLQSADRIDPYKVFERDGWACYICGIGTPVSLVGDHKHKQAPTLDHVVPLAKGGSHSYQNLRCACRRCNSKKRDSVLAANK